MAPLDMYIYLLSLLHQFISETPTICVAMQYYSEFIIFIIIIVFILWIFACCICILFAIVVHLFCLAQDDDSEVGPEDNDEDQFFFPNLRPKIELVNFY